MVKLKKDTKNNLKQLGWGLLAALAVFVVSNFNYLWQNVKYSFVKPVPIVVDTRPHPQGEPDTLIIPSLGITAPVKYAQGNTEPELQKLLLDGVVHYAGTAGPGQTGNDYIFGHSSDYVFSTGHYKTVFALLPKIQIGDSVLITDSSGNLFTYKVSATKVVSPSDLSVLSQQTNGQKILTVQTSYPVGTALKRFVAICELVE